MADTGAHRPVSLPPGTISWRTLLGEAVDRLASTGIGQPEHDAKRIVEEASGSFGVEYLATLDRPATLRGVARFDRMLARRAQGEPLQYVLGRWGFRTLDLLVDHRVLIPRPETEVVVGVALDEVDRLSVAKGASPHRPLEVVDLGTGSGAIALSMLAERSEIVVWATDQSDEALSVARANLAGLGTPATRARMLSGSWFSALPIELLGKVDVVVSNPPYVAAHETLPAEVAEWEPRQALIAGPTGMEAFEPIVADAPEWLAPGGALVVELAPHQSAAIATLAERRGLVDVAVHQDLTGRDRALVARRQS